MRSPHRCPQCRGRCYAADAAGPWVCVDCRSRWRFVSVADFHAQHGVRVLVAGIRLA